MEFLRHTTQWFYVSLHHVRPPMICTSKLVLDWFPPFDHGINTTNLLCKLVTTSINLTYSTTKSHIVPLFPFLVFWSRGAQRDLISAVILLLCYSRPTKPSSSLHQRGSKSSFLSQRLFPRQWHQHPQSCSCHVKTIACTSSFDTVLWLSHYELLVGSG